MPHPRVEAFSQIPHRRWMGTRGPGVDRHAWNWLKWCNLYFQKLVELSFAADEVSLVALSQFLFLFCFRALIGKEFVYFHGIASFSPSPPTWTKAKISSLACEQLSSPAHWRLRGKKKESLQQRLRNLNICIEKANAKCWLAEMTLVITSFPLAPVFQYLFTFALVSTSRWLAEI